jgi:MFS family permease
MTDQSTFATADPDPRRDRRLLRPLLEGVVVLAIFAAVGAACGWFWEHRSTPPSGLAYQGKWYPDSTGTEHVFDATGSFVVIAAIAGLVLGLLCAWLFSASEIVTVLAILAGGALAAWLMHTVGMHLAPSDPLARAKDAKDLTPLGGTLRTSGDSYRVAFPSAAVLGAALVYLCFPARRRPMPANPARS